MWVAYRWGRAETHALQSATHIRYTGTVGWHRHTHAKQANGQQRAYVGTALQQTNRNNGGREIGLNFEIVYTDEIDRNKKRTSIFFRKFSSMKKIILLISISVLLFGCKDNPPPAAVKQQKVIFDVSTISCKGDKVTCMMFESDSQQKCSAMSTKLSSELSSGWRVVTSTNKTKLISSSSDFSCEGTEYVLEK